MSHIVEIQTEVRCPHAVRAACQRLTLPPPVEGEHQLFGGVARGWGVQLPQWRYPVVCNTEQGRVQFDNYEGRWGAPARLDQFLQAYAVERTLAEARRQGHTCFEQPLANGSIQVTVQTGGAG